MDFIKSTFDNKPELVVNEGNVVRINFDIEDVEEEFPSMEESGETITRTVWKAYVVRVAQPMEYAAIVSAIINAKYDNDKMQAIVNNHLLEGNDTEHEEQYMEMQEWRIHAKDVAKTVMNPNEE